MIVRVSVDCRRVINHALLMGVVFGHLIEENGVGNNRMSDRDVIL